jgi:hypothetical protein
METNEVQPSRIRRRINDLVLAEMFLVQATIESATAISDGLGDLGRRISRPEDNDESPWDAIGGVLQRTADGAIEPYTSRFRYLKDLVL